jgi:hypothetical protein
VKDNNAVENLVFSCAFCNQRRGTHKMVRTQRARRSSMLTLDGIERPLGEWAATLGISRASLRLRLNTGWPLRAALTMPRGQQGPPRSARGLQADRTYRDRETEEHWFARKG